MWRRTPVWITVAAVGLLAVGGAGAAYALDERDDDDRSWSASDERRDDDRGDDDRGDDGRADADDRDDSWGSGGSDADDRDADADDRDAGDRDTTDRDAGDRDTTDSDTTDRDVDDRDVDDRADADDRGPGGPDSDDQRDTDDVPLTDAEVAAVTDAALAEAGGGTVTDVDRSDDRDHAFEVDVLLADGDELEVELDEAYGVVWTQLDPADRG